MHDAIASKAATVGSVSAVAGTDQRWAAVAGYGDWKVRAGVGVGSCVGGGGGVRDGNSPIDLQEAATMRTLCHCEASYDLTDE